MSLAERLNRWQQWRTANEVERDRIGYLNGPLPRNAPELLEPTRCVVLRPFFVGGQSVEVGAVVTLPRYDAVSLAAIGKVEL